MMNESALLLSAFENRLIVGLKRVTAGLNVRCQFVLFTNRKSHTVFRLVPKLMTLNDLVRHNGHCAIILRYIAKFGMVPLEANYFKPIEVRPSLPATNVDQNLHFSLRIRETAVYPLPV